MDEQSKVEVIRIDGPYALVALKMPLDDGTVPHVWAVGTAFTHETDFYDGEDDCTKQFSEAELSALALWWIQKNPFLLAQVLSEEQKEALELATRLLGDSDHSNALASIISPKEGSPHA